MNFSECFQATRTLVAFSPDGCYLASCRQHRLVVRNAASLQIHHLHTCLDVVQQLAWSPDSQFVLTAMFKRGMVQVWSLEQPAWTCKIDSGMAGLLRCWWAPDSRHLLTMADFGLQIALWSLVNKSISFIKHPKLVTGGLDFSSDGSYLALAERRDCKDFLSLFDCCSWQLVQHFPVGTRDLAGLLWSPDGRVLAVWDSVLDYKVLLYSLDGRCLASYSAYEHALGIKTVAWSLSSQFLAVGSFDEKVRVLNHLTWRAVAEHCHSSPLDCEGAVVYSEVEAKLPPLSVLDELSLHPLPSRGARQPQTRYETVAMPITVPSTKPDPEKPHPSLGVGVASFSPDCRYLATCNDNMATAVWVWDMERLQLAVLLLQTRPVTDVQWDPQQSRLAVATGASQLYLWSPAGCVSVRVPADPSFTLQKLVWHPAGTKLALVGPSHFCLCFLGSPAPEAST